MLMTAALVVVGRGQGCLNAKEASTRRVLNAEGATALTSQCYPSAEEATALAPQGCVSAEEATMLASAQEIGSKAQRQAMDSPEAFRFAMPCAIPCTCRQE